MKRKAKQGIVSDSQKRRSWLVPSFVFSILVIIAIAAIWQKSQDPSAGDPDLVAEVGLLTEEGIRSTVTVAELERIRGSIQSQYSNADRANKIRLLKLRIATADRGLEIAKSKSTRKSFQLDQMRILLVLCWMERKNNPDPVNNARRLKELSTLFLGDADQELSHEAHRCHLSLAGCELLNAPGSQERATNFKQAIELVSGKYSGDVDVVADIRLILDDLLGDPRTGLEVIELMRFVSEKYKNSDREVIRDWAAMLKDQTFFAECDFQYKVSLCEQDVEPAYEATLNLIPYLLSKNLSPFGIKRFLSVANVYESNGKFDHAKRLFRIILDWVVDTDTRPAVEEIRIACQLGIRRVESVGKPFQFEGVDVEKESLKAKDYTGKVVLVFFVGDEKEIEKVRDCVAGFKLLEKNGLKILIVGLGFDSTDLLAAVGKNRDSDVTWIADKNRSGSIVTQCPAVILPYGMIVDRKGNVAKLAVYDDRLQQALENMVFD